VLKPEHRHYAEELRLAGGRSSALLRRLVLSPLAPVEPGDRRLATRSEADPACSMATAAREDAGRACANPARPVSLRTIVDRCSGLLGQVAGGRAIEVSYGDAASVPVIVPEETIERILVNLVRNAAAGLKESDGGATRHWPAGGRIMSESVVVHEASDLTEDETPGAIRIRAGLPVSRAGDSRPWPLRRVRLTVEDSGCGMTLAHLDQVLNPSKAPPRGRHGMGLRVVRELVAASGGELRMLSAPGIGTQVQIDWPAAPTTPSEAIEGGRSSSLASIQGGQAESLRLSQSGRVRVTQEVSNGRVKRAIASMPVKAGAGFREQRTLVSAAGPGRRISC
jgi:signal transduction histidine kinase